MTPREGKLPHVVCVQVAAALACALGGQAARAAEQEPAFRYQEWQAKAYFDPADDRLLHCSAVNGIPGGSSVSLSLKRTMSLGIKLRTREPSFAFAGDEVALELDGRTLTRADPQIRNAREMDLNFGRDLAAAKRALYGDTLRVTVGDTAVAYAVEGIDGALDRLEDCVRTRVAAEAPAVVARRAEPAPPRRPAIAPEPMPRPQTVTTGYDAASTSLDAQALSLFVVNMLSGAGVTGYRLLSDTQKPSFMSHQPVVWIGPGRTVSAVAGDRFGSLEAVFDMVDEAPNRIGQAGAAACEGKFASVISAPKLEDDVYQRTVETACETEDGAWQWRHTLFGTRDRQLIRLEVVELPDGEPFPGGGRNLPPKPEGFSAEVLETSAVLTLQAR